MVVEFCPATLIKNLGKAQKIPTQFDGYIYLTKVAILENRRSSIMDQSD